MTRVNRRTFLKGLGASAGLASSFFGSRIAMGQTEEAPLRVMFVALQHGWGVNPGFGRNFEGSEYDFTLPKQLQAFEAIKDQMVFIDGARGTLWGNAHDVSYTDILTAATPWGENGNDDNIPGPFPIPEGPSIDYVIAQHANKPALRLSARYRSWVSTPHPMSWDDQKRVLYGFSTPTDAYDAIIEPMRSNLQNPPSPGKLAARSNLFDYLGKDTERLRKKVSGTEQRRLEDYLSGLNTLSERLQQKEELTLTVDDLPTRPTQSPAFDASIDNYFDMIRLGFKFDTHRVAVLGFGEGLDDWAWIDKNGMMRSGNPWDEGFHHAVAHYNKQDDPDVEDRRNAYDYWVDWYAKKIVQFVQSLASTPDVDGRSLLDNTLIVLTGEVGTGTHDTRNKLHTLIGGGDRLPRGRWIESPKVEPRMRDGIFIGGQTRAGEVVESGINYGSPFSMWHTADVLKAVGNLAGVPLTSFGLETNNRSPIALDLTT